VSRGTHNRNVRVSDELWDAARAKAEAEGRNLSEIIREALQEYVDTSGER
jgi:predicted HicB family RNase H-like nuclease